jgi:hypothetical protein
MKNTMNHMLSGILLLGLTVMITACRRQNPNELTSELLPLQGNPLVQF